MFDSYSGGEDRRLLTHSHMVVKFIIIIIIIIKCSLVTNDRFCGCAESACSKFRTANQITGSLQVTRLSRL